MTKTHRLFLFFFLATTSALSYAKSVSYFEGKKFRATIEYGCSEGNVSCNKVHLTSIKKADKSSIKLNGGTININCPDTCDFKGYNFKNGKYNYSFYPSIGNDDLWNYIVTLNGKVIAKDSGPMK